MRRGFRSGGWALLVALLTALFGQGAGLAQESARLGGTQRLGPRAAFDRSDHAAVLLANGDWVLVVGGESQDESLADLSANEVRSQAEIWRIGSSTWRWAGKTRHYFEGATATVLQDGRVLLAGGGGTECCGGPGSRFVEVWDPEKRAWKNSGRLLQPRFQHRAVGIGDGRVVVIGGTRTVGDPVVSLATIELWDPKTEHWSFGEPMSVSRYLHTATGLKDGRVLVAGGYSTSAPAGLLNGSEVFDPTTGHWKPLKPMQQKRAKHEAVALHDGRVLVVAGDAHGTSEVWDPTTEQWSAAGRLKVNRYSFSATALGNGDVLVAGGYEEKRNGVPVVAIELWDHKTSLWRPVGNLLRGRVCHTATLLPDGRVMFVGGIRSRTEKGTSTEFWGPPVE